MYRSKNPDNYIWIWLGVFGTILLVIGLIVNLFTMVKLRDLKTSLADIDKQKTVLFNTNLPTAEMLVSENSPKYAKRWSADFPDQLQNVRDNLQLDGGVDVALFGANEALKKKDIRTASVFRDQADLLIKEAGSVLTHILGPPTFYEELNRKSVEVDDYIAQVESTIKSTKGNIDSLKQDSWNRSHGVVFSRSYRRLNEASEQLTAARAILIAPLQNDNVQFDRVAAYDAVTGVQSTVKEANDWANSDHTMARNADTAITDAVASITTAETYVQFSSYNTWQARQTVNTAKTIIVQARSAFSGSAGIDPNYQLAYELAINAKSQADLAVWQATEPTPTPKPPPTAVPSSSNDDSYNSPSWDSEPDYSNSSDWNSGSDNWGTDDWGGSDDWGSSDDWGGSDDWGSDDGW